MKIRFVFGEDDVVEVDAYDQLNVLAHGQIAERSLQSRCGGHCDCSTCRIVLVEGKLSPMKAGERELLAKVGVTDPRVRLACQSFPEAELVVVEVPAKKFKDARGGPKDDR